MATTRIMPLHVGKGRTESRAISDIIDYVANPRKTDNGRRITGYACDSRTADAEFLLAKRQYIAATGRVRGTDDVIAYHVRQSFRPGEITPEEANRLGDQAKLSGWEKAARMDSLGEGYGLEDLRAVLLGKKAHTPRKKTVTQAEPPKVNLLVDIQAKLQAGKGAGYARWAKVFNLKQMAQTMNYLSENNLLEYAVLEEKAAAATAHHNDLSAQIKAAEKSMTEIAVLRTHIVNYSKTREVYVAYRKAGYSKKFREEHEEEILLHQAAKNAFDEMGVKKLPKVKELQTEYAKLLEEKKKTYAEYRHSREEMRELLTAKANVDRVLKMEVEQDVEKGKDHGQR